ncbi:hypothetical protein L226DRAFT_557796 [Lentinus tigrinus ALCF2SS1-7]|uniref:Hydrophobin n=1 Tax=Lentinus tigrinus ALCF2SS1-6 TaxID=1328759 RepID=A0A5C2SWQ7_9APHY|nr:hypothetical protein L227DRAFT_597960 [Lentinus tigrinus ALCF2SS1-6]RPD79075.1 hypothetical protein L226DRAFT_557796 [Lentinus tigrinus ALCF2SS1-7]
MMFARLTAILPVVLAATFVGASIVPRCDSPGSGSGSSGSGSSGSSGSGSGSSGSGSGSSGSGSGSSGSGSSGSGSGSSGSGSGSSGSVPAGDCNTGPVQCCNQTFDTQHHSPDLLTGLLGVDVGDLTGLLAVQCSPINIIGIGGVQCDATPVCCSNTASGGLVNIGCVPVIL